MPPRHQEAIDSLKEQIIVTAPLVTGFSLTKKCWALFHLSRVSNAFWNDQASLVLKQSTKQGIQSLIATHMKPDGIHQDIIAGKGEGAVLVLHGLPRTGKPLTTESEIRIRNALALGL
jgi:hypothetical protein